MSIQPSVLIVEDEADITELLRFALQRAGFEVRTAQSLSEAQQSLKAVLPQVVVLDWMLPDGDGATWLKTLRADERSRHLPILMLTARAQESDKLQGLDNGADDYMTKPFSPKELVARINSIMRRSAPQHVATSTTFKDCVLHDDDLALQKGGVRETLGNTEFKLLKYLLTHPDKSYTRNQLLDFVWGDHVYIEERTVDVHVLRLRKILQRFELEAYLETVRGVGYRWRSTLPSSPN